MTTILARRHRVLLTGLLSGALLLAGCGGGSNGAAPAGDPTPEAPAPGPEPSPSTESPQDETPPTETRLFEADNGTIEIPVEPERVVALAGAVRYLLEFGVEPVGVSTETDDNLRWLTDDEAAVYEAATNVGSGAELDYERIASLEPDLIVLIVPGHAWGNYDDARFQSIAPTVYLQFSTAAWKEVGERGADAVGRAEVFTEQKAAYEQAADEIRQTYGDLLDSMTFAVVNRWPSSQEGMYTREYAASYCAVYAVEAGLDIPGSPSADVTGPFEAMSMERLSDLDEVDAIIYPLDADGTPKDEFLPVLESNAWQTLPAVTSGRALGVGCANTLSYANGLRNLESLDQALSTLPEAG